MWALFLKAMCAIYAGNHLSNNLGDTFTNGGTKHEQGLF